jgi:chorismate mutase/prephenate dehydratase
MVRKASIPALRRQIDRIDDQLLRLLNRRAEVVLAIAAEKAQRNSKVYAPAREKAILARVSQANRGPLAEPLVRAVFREIISASRSLEQALRIAYLGPEATFTHLAARQQFGALADYRPAASVAEVFHEVESGRADLGVVPVENSTEGMVAHTLDLLADSALRICAEIVLPVRHNLLARRSSDRGGDEQRSRGRAGPRRTRAGRDRRGRGRGDLRTRHPCGRDPGRARERDTLRRARGARRGLSER